MSGLQALKTQQREFDIASIFWHMQQKASAVFPQLLLRQRIVTLQALPSAVLEVHLQIQHHMRRLGYFNIA